MEYIGTNEKIKDIRLEKDMTLKEASHFLGLSRMRLRLYEGGYLKIRYKDREKFILKYELDSSFFEGDLEYPTFKKEEKVITNKTPIQEKTSVIVLAFVFLIISISGFLSGNYVSNYAANNPNSFFSEEYVDIQDYANENYKEENHHYDMLYNDNYNEFYNEGYDEHNQAKIQIYEESRNLSYTTYFHRHLINNNHNEMNYYYNGDGMDIMFYYDDYTGTVYRDFVHDNKYESIYGYNEQSQKVKLKASDPKFKEIGRAH